MATRQPGECSRCPLTKTRPERSVQGHREHSPGSLVAIDSYTFPATRFVGGSIKTVHRRGQECEMSFVVDKAGYFVDFLSQLRRTRRGRCFLGLSLFDGSALNGLFGFLRRPL